MLLKAVRERHGRTRGCELIRSPAWDKMPQESNAMEERYLAYSFKVSFKPWSLGLHQFGLETKLNMWQSAAVPVMVAGSGEVQR